MFASLILVATTVLAEHDRVDLPIVATVGMDARDGDYVARTSLYVLSEGALCVEAEQASSVLESMQAYRMMPEAGAAGGAFVIDPKAIRVRILVSKAGRFTLHLRMRKNPKTWRHRTAQINTRRGEKRSPELASVKIDGKPLPVTALSPFEEVEKKWGWQKIADLPLSAGLHAVTLGDLPGFHLDRLVLSPRKNEGKAGGAEVLLDPAEDDGDEEVDIEDEHGSPLDELKPDKRRVVTIASAETAEIAPLSVSQWGRLLVEGRFAGSRPAVSISTDRGKTWLKVQEDGDLSKIRPEGNGQDRLRAKLEWRFTKAVQPPRLSGLSVTWTKGRGDPITLSGPGMSLLLERKTSCMHEILCSAGRRLALPMRRDLFSLGWQTEDGRSEQLSSSAFDLMDTNKIENGERPGWSFRFKNQHASLEAVCEVIPARKAQGLWTWRLNLKNSGKGLVRHVRFPSFDGLLFGKNRFRPASLWGSRGVTGIFPGDMSMGFMLVHDGKAGLYLASHDKTLTGAGFEHRRAGPLTHTATISYGVVPPGQTRQYEFASAFGTSDWHWAADHYRQWAYSWMKRPAAPDWAKRMDGWWNLMTDTEAALLDRRSTTLFEDARWFGLRHIQSWVGCGDGSFVGRMPYLSPRLGTPEMSKKDSERIRSLGGHIGHYIQAREWNANYATDDLIGYVPRRFFPNNFQVPPQEWSHRNKIQNAGDHQIMCPASHGWQDFITRQAVMRAEKFGNDTVYFDQMGCTVMACGRREHGHGLEHQVSGAGYTKMAQKIVSAMQAENPDIAISNEGVNAATGQFVQFHLISCLPYVGFKSDFLYTFPDLALVNGSSNGAATYGVPHRQHFRSLYLMHRFEVPTYDLYFRNVILLRQRVHDWQYDGRFMDDVGLETTAGGESSQWAAEGFKPRTGVIAKWFLYEKGKTSGVLINFLNEQKIAGSKLSLARSKIPFEPNGRAFALFDDGTVEPIRYAADNRSLTFDVPARRVGSLLISGAVQANEALRCFAWQSSDAGTDRLVLGAVNISGKPIDGNWTVEHPKSFDLEVDRGSCTIDAFSAKRVEIPLKNLLAVQEMADVRIRWSYGDQQKDTIAVLSPPLRNGNMDLDENKDGSPDSWWNFSNSFCHILHRWVHGIDMRSLPAVVDMEVKRSGRASMRMRGPAPFRYSIASRDGVPAGRKGVFPISASQHLYLKPRTSYQITAYAFCRDSKARCKLSAGGSAAGPVTPLNDWQELSVRFKTPDSIRRIVITLANTSGENVPVWFDDITITER